MVNSITNYSKDHKYTLFIFLIFLLFLIYIITKMNVNIKNCTTIQEIRKDNTNYNTFYNFSELINQGYFQSNMDLNNQSIQYQYKLKDFYIKTAYNCFCSGKFKNDYVNTCALVNCASYGVRALDMQIFSLNNQPIVAASSVNTNLYKETYNHILLNDALAEINKIYFKDTYFINNESVTIENNLNEDPLFLILRLHYGNNNNENSLNSSFNDKKISFYNKIYELLVGNLDSEKFNSQIIKTFYGNEYETKRPQIIGNQTMESLINKIFIFVILNDEPGSSVIKKSKLHDIVDLYGFSDELNAVRFDEIDDESGSYAVNRYKTRNQLTYCMPMLSYHNLNYDFVIPFGFGVQFVGMNFQKQDEQLDLYNKFFIEQFGEKNTEVTSPYIKKPDHMIEFPISITIN